MRAAGWLKVDAQAQAAANQEMHMVKKLQKSEEETGASSALAGGRVDTLLKETPSAISVLTAEFLEDAGPDWGSSAADRRPFTMQDAERMAGTQVEFVYAGIAGEHVQTMVSKGIVAVNGEIEDHPELVNEDPHREGWLIEVELDDEGELDELLATDGYEEFVAQVEDDEELAVIEGGAR